MMMLDTVLELSVEQLVGVLNKKLFTECTWVRGEMPSMSRALVATLTKSSGAPAPSVFQNATFKAQFTPLHSGASIFHTAQHRIPP